MGQWASSSWTSILPSQPTTSSQSPWSYYVTSLKSKLLSIHPITKACSKFNKFTFFIIMSVKSHFSARPRKMYLRCWGKFTSFWDSTTTIETKMENRLVSWIYFLIWLLLLLCRCGISKIIKKFSSLYKKITKNLLKLRNNGFKV